jgi:hypothetical protein
MVVVCKNLHWGMPYGGGPKVVLESKFLSFLVILQQNL